MSTAVTHERRQGVDMKQFQQDEDFILRRWREVTINGWNTRILDIGEGEPILFVPITQHIEVFDSRLIQHFARTNRVLFFQRRETTTKDLYVADRVRDIKSILDYIGIKKVHIAAHSSGAGAALFFVIEHQEYVKSFVLQCLSPRVTIPKFDNFLATYIAPFLPRKVLLDLLTSRCAERGTPEYNFVYGQWNKFPDIKRAWVHSIWTMAQYDSRPYLSQIRVPVLLINTDNDDINTVQAMEYFDQHLPNSYGLKVIHGGKHFYQYWKADDVILHMEEFYNRLAEEERKARESDHLLVRSPEV